MNNWNGIGRLVRDPDLRFIPGEKQNAVCNFTLAVDRGLSKEKKEELKSQGKQTADFPRIVVYGKIAENCANYLAKGRLVGIDGRIQTGSYTDKDGKKVYTTDIVAYKVHFLEWGEKKQDNNDFDNDGVFRPVDDEEIPF